MSEPIKLSRDVKAVQIPHGAEVILTKDSEVVITQSLGGSYTIHSTSMGGLMRISGQDADALGLAVETKVDSDKPLDEQVWDMLKTCFDPEIPVNIVDLGLIYSMELNDGENGKRAEVKMTLTAAGCGMGPSIAADAREKIMTLKGIESANVDVVWDPPWMPSMISPAGKERLGMA
ncbi:MAG: iron-sulfur cluster assembly protein [Verrucomicrobiota bacterium]|nr:iron-sulfur cluster assembly protein [Verrucomicrobiota bacterium]